ncbi:D-amino acid dehydrogenase [Devosia ginsengisoli]|uniref:D-amino acid dehydrogenase n=1 Tax=Devosia ginsengisoli TaxID=400770 RepID=UPI0026F193F0|nr:D-amino acid dehydrogenase [Devosia ginsengisoli]MCR6671869.1 D-amino acid dehydrogenase [Devosia ginsengisoli]
MDIIVLGAGIVGVATAYCLAQEGHTVRVVERQAAAGLETSFANGSQLVAHGGGPWSAPGVPTNLLKWFGRRDAPLMLRLSAIPGLWRWGPQFLLNCTQARWTHNAISLHHLAMSSIRELDRIVADERLEFDQLRKGILVVHKSQQAFDAAAAHVAVENAAGMRKHAVDAEACIALEPALTHQRHQISGGIYAEADRTGDCLSFTQALATAALRLGVTFDYQTRIESITSNGRSITGVVTDKGRLQADRYVMCLGSYSPLLSRQVGIDLPIYPVKGYSATVSVDGWDGAPTISLIDASRKMGFSRLGNRLRIAGTAEFAGHSTTLDADRGKILLDGLLEMFPFCPGAADAMHWSGLRPMTPDGVPVVGRTRLDNLLINSGHGTLGWSLSCGSARLICELIGNRTPEIDPGLYAPERRYF